MKKVKVVALVPAYNEAETIKRTVASLMNQTYPFEFILVIANNCTDDTVKIVRRLRAKYRSKGGFPELKLMVMKNNKGKKSGALNAGFATVKKNIDFIFGMDGDTIIDHRMVEEGLKQFAVEPTTGGICSAYRTLPLKENASHWERFLWRLQNIEFILANAWRVENYKSARVLPGVSVMFRTEALNDVAALEVIVERTTKKLAKSSIHLNYRQLTRKVRAQSLLAFKDYKSQKGAINRLLRSKKIPEVWATHSLVEDYHLTLDLKDLGWQVKSSLDMISWSDVPLKLRGKGGLWDQRQRWYSGTVDEIRLRRLKKHSRYEIFTIVLLMVNLVMTLLLISAYLTLVVESVPIIWVSYFLILPVLASMTSIYRLKGGDQLDKWQKLFTATIIINELYAFYRELIYAYSIWVSYSKPDREW